MHLYYLIRNFAFTKPSHYVAVYYLRLKNHDNECIYKTPLITTHKLCWIKGSTMRAVVRSVPFSIKEVICDKNSAFSDHCNFIR